VFVIEGKYLPFAPIDPECRAPVAHDGESPSSFAVAGAPVNVPAQTIPEFPSAFHLLQDDQDVTDPLDDELKARSIIPLDESPQPPSYDIPSAHKP
jgi:hypothetical protein